VPEHLDANVVGTSLHMSHLRAHRRGSAARTDARGEGRINSPNTERGYRDTLNAHAVDIDGRDPRSTVRDDVKRTLQRWPNPNTRRKNRSILVSFYDWAMQELEPPRDNNPARQTRPPKSRKPHIYRMTRGEVVAFLGAATTRRERRIAYLGVCAGIRNHELRHLQRRHFERPAWVQISADIAKGGRERWVPVLPELEPIVAEILANVDATVWDPVRRTWLGEYVIPECAGAARPRGRRDDADVHRGADARRAGCSGLPIRSETNRRSNRPSQTARGADRNRTGVHGFAGRCVATPPRRRGGGAHRRT
jgi:hypothetical protein